MHRPRAGLQESPIGAGCRPFFGTPVAASRTQPRRDALLLTRRAPLARIRARAAGGWCAVSLHPPRMRRLRLLGGREGAAAFQPRKCQRGRCALAGKHRFNGAAAFQPRKSRRIRRRARPRCCFNGAAAFQPRKSTSTWRNGWSFRCFNGAAAFQPRKFSRSGYAHEDLDVLQWGRGFSAAEIPRRMAHAVIAAWLQWGRGFSAAEMCWQELSSRSSCRRFNGAAAFQPRKFWRMAMPPSASRCFNGAAAFQPRKCRRADHAGAA